MAQQTSNTDLATIASRLRGASGSIAVLTHAKPDGDAFGSVVAMVAALREAGLEAQGFILPPLTPALRGQRGVDLLTVLPDEESAAALPEAALYLVVDTGAVSQLGGLSDRLAADPDRVIVVDHHLTGDLPAGLRFIDTGAAAACEIVHRLIETLSPGLLDRPTATGTGVGAGTTTGTGLSGDEALATIRDALYIGIASDTGWFSFSNTTAHTLRLAATLVEAGVDGATIRVELEQNERMAKLHLMCRALDGLEVVDPGEAAIMTLRASDFLEVGASEADTERLINVPLMVGSIRVVALVSEPLNPAGDAPAQPGEQGPLTRISLRSKPPSKTRRDAVDVAKLALAMGGGGHARAAGAKYRGDLDAAVVALRGYLAGLDRFREA